jgi:DNA repair exonuclease SbcCD ATPase subunit
MRLKSIGLSGFRSFAAEKVLDLDADAIILVGPNGAGKTSLLDGVLWAICGQIPRIAGGDAALVSLYSASGRARVELSLTDGSRDLEVVRAFDGQQSTVSLRSSGVEARGPAAFAQLCAELWPDATATGDEAAALAAAMTRSVYLQQDLVRQFIDADTDQERFIAVSELVGAGRIAEMQVQLDNERSVWTRGTNEAKAQQEKLELMLVSLEARLDSLADVNSASMIEIEDAWSDWWSNANLLSGDPVTIPALGLNSGQAIEDGLRNLTISGREKSRRLDEARVLAFELHSPRQQLPDLTLLRGVLNEREALVNQAQIAVQQVEAVAAEERRRQVELNDAAAEVRTMAQLALRHLDERCPVCDQEYDRDRTRTRLEEILETAGVSGGEVSRQLLEQAVQALRIAEEQRSESALIVRSAESVVREEELRVHGLQVRLSEFSIQIEGVDASEALDTLISQFESDVAAIARAIEDGGRLAALVARVGEAARRDEMEREISSVRADLANAASSVAARERTGDLVSRLVEGLRRASSDVVKEEIERIEPLLQQVFSTIDPHPAFRQLRLLTHFAQRRGRVSAILEDREFNKSTESPELVLSSSQLNGLAVSVFLALNLGMRSLPLQTLIIDDPLQSLDDVNLLGLVDLLRRTREHRQVVITTHDPRFGELLARKLRPVSEGQRTLLYRFNAWSRIGPTIDMEEVQKDAAQLRIASSAA